MAIRRSISGRRSSTGSNSGETPKGFDLLVLGPKAAGTGLTLTAATHVLHLSRWWNPAVEEQCNDRVHRIGQTNPVTVHILMAVHPAFREHSFDCLLHSLMQRKRKLASPHCGRWATRMAMPPSFSACWPKELLRPPDPMNP